MPAHRPEERGIGTGTGRGRGCLLMDFWPLLPFELGLSRLLVVLYHPLVGGEERKHKQSGWEPGIQV